MFKKFIVLLLSLNLIATGFIVSWTWKVNKDLLYQSEAVKLLVSTKLKNTEDNEKFKEDVYKGLSLLMSGESQLATNQERLNICMLRIHHFVEPHADRFYKDCPECQREKGEIERDSITLK